MTCSLNTIEPLWVFVKTNNIGASVCLMQLRCGKSLTLLLVFRVLGESVKSQRVLADGWCQMVECIGGSLKRTAR